MEEEILQSFLEKKVNDAKEEIKEKGILSENNALYLIINFLYNHIGSLEKNMATLEKNMATKDDVKDMARQEDVKKNEESIKDIMKNMARQEDVKKNEESIKDIINKMATKDDIKAIEKEINTIKEHIRRMEYIVMFGIALLAIIITLLQIFTQ